MKSWITGGNSSGKTLILNEKLDKNIANGKRVVTNIRDIGICGFDSKRLEYVCSDEVAIDILHYVWVESDGDLLRFSGNDIGYSSIFLKLLTLLCRPGDILILDEPEYGLQSIELRALCELLPRILSTFSSYYIATHREYFMSVDEDNWYKI